jgi:hypothetical protein
MPGTQRGSNRERHLKRSERKIVWVNDAHSARIDYTGRDAANHFEIA